MAPAADISDHLVDLVVAQAVQASLDRCRLQRRDGLSDGGVSR
jgi:hypothetical protein